MNRRVLGLGLIVAIVAGGVGGWVVLRGGDDDGSDVPDDLRLADQLGCTAVGKPSQADVEPEGMTSGSVESYDCWVEGEFFARVQTFAVPAQMRVRRDYLVGMRYGSPSGLNRIDECPNALDPVVVSGDDWLALVGGREAADKVAELTGGEVQTAQGQGPIVSYLPVLPPCPAG